VNGYPRFGWVDILRFQQRDYGEIKEYDVSGVDKVDNHSEAKEVSRYSLDGQRLSVPVKGLNIVRYSDGSIKKVVVN